MGGVKPKVAPCGKLIFLLAICGVVWYPVVLYDGQRWKRQPIGARLLWVSLPQHWKTSTKCVVFFWRNELNSNTIPNKFTYITFKKDTPKPLIHSVIDWPAPRLPSPHLVLTCLLSSPIPSSLFVCICANVCTISSVRPLGTTPVRFPHPLQKALFALRDLREPALLKASQDCWEEPCGAGKSYKPHNFDNTDVFRCS